MYGVHLSSVHHLLFSLHLSLSVSLFLIVELTTNSKSWNKKKYLECFVSFLHVLSMFLSYLIMISTSTAGHLKIKLWRRIIKTDSRKTCFVGKLRFLSNSWVSQNKTKERRKSLRCKWNTRVKKDPYSKYG